MIYAEFVPDIFYCIYYLNYDYYSTSFQKIRENENELAEKNSIQAICIFPNLPKYLSKNTAWTCWF